MLLLSVGKVQQFARVQRERLPARRGGAPSTHDVDERDGALLMIGWGGAALWIDHERGPDSVGRAQVRRHQEDSLAPIALRLEDRLTRPIDDGKSRRLGREFGIELLRIANFGIEQGRTSYRRQRNIESGRQQGGVRGRYPVGVQG